MLLARKASKQATNKYVPVHTPLSLSLSAFVVFCTGFEGGRGRERGGRGEGEGRGLAETPHYGRQGVGVNE